MSLRARLILLLLALTAVGMVVLAGVTYAEQRSFLYDRVDDQLKGVPTAGAALHQLCARNSITNCPDVADPSGAGYGPGNGNGANGNGANGSGSGYGGPPFGRGGLPGFGPGGPGGRNRPDPAGIDLPPGTYSVLRDADGKQVGQPQAFSYGQDEAGAPKLPDNLAAGKTVSVGATGADDLQYRARAIALENGYTLIVAIPLHDADKTLSRLLIVELLVIGGVLLALAGAAWWIVRLGLRPLDRIGATAGAIAAGDLSRRVEPATSKTEVGRLGLSLNAMLARLEEAFAERKASEDRLRRFLSDASHELRTPLASIRGYAELFRMGAASDPESTAKAMSRIEQEAARMGVLVEDLLMLARLDEMRVQRREPVDLAELAADAAGDARATAPDRAIDDQTDEPAIVSGDPDQLRQVLANLLRNALVHTPPGTAIDVSVTSAPTGRVRLVVRDHGPGLPTDDGDALFDRFWRSEAERGRRQGPAGAGLGLAIVAGIVAAHDGTVHARNHPDGGAMFTVDLPAGPSQPAHQPRPAEPARA